MLMLACSKKRNFKPEFDSKLNWVCLTDCASMKKVLDSIIPPTPTLLCIVAFCIGTVSIISTYQRAALWKTETSLSYRSSPFFPGLISDIVSCNPLSLIVLGHAKSATTDLYTLLVNRFHNIFTPPNQKEIGCLSGNIDNDKCISSINGPAKCHAKGSYYTGLTLDVSPRPLHFAHVRYSRLSSNLVSHAAAACVIILREPIATMQSLFNHWHSGYNESFIPCDRCSLNILVTAELEFLMREDNVVIVDKLLSGLEDSSLNFSTLETSRNVLLDRYEKLPGISECKGLGFPHLRFAYVLDSIFELEILPYRQLMHASKFLILDYQLYSDSPNEVRDALFEILFGSEKYRIFKESDSLPSWENQDHSNVKRNKSSCAILSNNLKCDVAHYLSRYSKRFFALLRKLESLKAITILAKARHEWWDSEHMYC